MGSADDRRFMQMALDLGREGLGWSSPNPSVGAVVVKRGRIIGQGFHRKAGEPHAEVLALQAAGARSQGATLYVTLEPCAHYGRTPPCADAVIAAGIRRVVVGTRDPNPRVSGEGIRRLRAAGIEVRVGVLRSRAEALHAGFIHCIRTGMPLVTLKLAMTLDGKIATRTGDSRWVTSEASREWVHQMRREHDAVMVGSNTVATDDPQLTCRLPGEAVHQPRPVVVDSLLRTPPQARVFSDATARRPVAACIASADAGRRRALERQGVEVVCLPGDTHVDIAALMTALGERAVTSVLLEGGGTLAAAALAAGMVHRIAFFYAPRIVGGTDAPTGVGGFGIATMAGALTVTGIRLRRVGPDILVTGTVRDRLE